uniref:Uncharacterized protein n=1 Tax=Anguilla anguilla TaxID=7936 RepID=A0A0E9QQM4_ANGAN
MGPAAPAHHPVLPDFGRALRGPVPHLRLHAPLERRPRGPHTGSHNRHSDCNVCDGLL